jgi:hypothetical protein
MVYLLNMVIYQAAFVTICESPWQGISTSGASYGWHFFPAQFFGDKNHTGFLDFPTDFPFFSHGLSRKAERGVERTASGEEEKLHPTGKKKAIPPHRREKRGPDTPDKGKASAN